MNRQTLCAALRSRRWLHRRRRRNRRLLLRSRVRRQLPLLRHRRRVHARRTVRVVRASLRRPVTRKVDTTMPRWPARCRAANAIRQTFSAASMPALVRGRRHRRQATFQCRARSRRARSQRFCVTTASPNSTSIVSSAQRNTSLVFVAARKISPTLMAVVIMVKPTMLMERTTNLFRHSNDVLNNFFFFRFVSMQQSILVLGRSWSQSRQRHRSYVPTAVAVQ